MIAAPLTPARQETLLELAGALAERLRKVRVSFADGETADVGLPHNCLGKVEGLLRRARDAGEFRETLGLLHQLDPFEAQNADRPKDQYRTLREELHRFLDAHPDHAVDEWLFVLGWVRRLLLPGERGGNESRSRRASRPGEARRERPATHEAAPPPPAPAPPARRGERVWNGVSLVLERGHVVARQGRDRVAEDTSSTVPAEVVARLRRRERVVADVVVIPGLGATFRIVEVRDVR